jgi:hypothetical protein
MAVLRRMSGLIAVAISSLCCLAQPGFAAEVHSNGVGGGNWSAPATWKTRAVPTPDDIVVIARGDVVAFDRDDTGKITCAQLNVDPRGGLEFKPVGTIVMCVAGPIESYGSIRIDATKVPKDVDRMELRLVAKDYAARSVKMLKGSSFQVRGKSIGPDKEKNAVLASMPGNAPPAAPNVNDLTAAQGLIDAVTGVMLDINNTRVTDMVVQGSGINNTGSKPTERLNITDCAFTSTSRVFFTSCDTPTLVKCVFGDPKKPVKILPVTLNSSPLCELGDNKFYGYQLAVHGISLTEPSIQDNLFEDCDTAMTFTSSTGVMIKRDTINKCATGISFNSSTAVIEDTMIDGAKSGLYLEGSSSLQATSFGVTNVPAGGMGATLLGSSEMKLLNSNLAPAQIKLGVPKSQKSVVNCNYFVVVRVPGQIGGPKGKPAVNIVRENITPPLKEGAQDLMVRNSPADVYDEHTALPGTLRAVTVRGWEMLADGKIQPAPTYHAEIGKIVREGAKGDEEDVFKLVKKGPQFTPDEKLFRAKPDSDPPTLSINP